MCIRDSYCISIKIGISSCKWERINYYRLESKKFINVNGSEIREWNVCVIILVLGVMILGVMS